MKHAWLFTLLMLFVLCGAGKALPRAGPGKGSPAIPPPPAAAREPSLDERVGTAIEDGAKFLWSQRKPDGSWDGYSKQVNNKYPVGPTALAAYALLESDVSPQDKRMARTLEWLAEQDCTKTYSLGLRASVWEAANRTTNRKYYKYLVADADRLMQSCAWGHYHYDSKGRESSGNRQFDNSNSQYGVLGVWAAARDGVEVPIGYWNVVQQHWLRYQHPATGGWGYREPTKKNKQGRVENVCKPTMTTAALATLYVCMDNLHAQRYANCLGNTESNIEAINKGLRWLEKKFAGSIGGGSQYFYYLYCMERVGLASGHKYFGKADWYKAAALKMLPKQKNGKWGNGVVDTSFALLFLVRGRNPVLFNKLQFDGDWNNRPRDLATLTRWISATFEKTVNWQIVKLDTPVTEWHDAPILYISGAKAPKFSDADLAKLRKYVHQGGTIFSATECSGKAFAKEIRRVYAKLFPQYELVPAGRNHGIYSAHFKLPGTPRLHVVSNGVRPLVIHTDVDLPKSWQLYKTSTDKGHFEAAANIFLYVTGQGTLRNRGTVHWPAGTDAAPAMTVRVARLRHNGNCNPEPLALKRLGLLMARRTGTKLDLVGPIYITDLPEANVKVAVMSGTGGFTLADKAKRAISRFLAGGGLLVIDAAGGAVFTLDPRTKLRKSVGFAASAEKLLEELFPENPLRRLSSQAALLRLPHYNIERVRYLLRTRKRLGATTKPNFRAVARGDRVNVIFSREDLTAGLLGCTAATVDGYDPNSAYELMRNIILHAAYRPPPEKPKGGSGLGR